MNFSSGSILLMSWENGISYLGGGPLNSGPVMWAIDLAGMDDFARSCLHSVVELTAQISLSVSFDVERFTKIHTQVNLAKHFSPLAHCYGFAVGSTIQVDMGCTLPPIPTYLGWEL